MLANVGSVKTNGVEAALTWRPMNNLSWFTSVAWNDSEYADDYTATSSSGVPTVVPVSGKQVTDTPEMLVKSELAYDNGAFFARADVNFTDERFYTYLNEGSVDSYTLLNVGVGYRFKPFGPAKELVLQADATNLTDEEYFSTIDSNGFVNCGPERHDADTAARRAAAVLRLDQSAVLTTPRSRRSPARPFLSCERLGIVCRWRYRWFDGRR